MGLTFGKAPLGSRGPSTVNYTIDGPRHRLLLEPFSRRVRGLVDGAVVLDTTRGALLHESNLLPQLYLPVEDLDQALLTPSSASTHCPFKGDASYWSMTVGERTLDDVVWAYPDPLPAASWLSGLAAVAFGDLDSWLDEDEQVLGHLRDPYHRVDVRASGRRVRVRHGETVVADTTDAVVCSETGLPNRWYVPRSAVIGATLRPSQQAWDCPYKGHGTYWDLIIGSTTLPDAAWGFAEPLDGASALRGRVCLVAEDLVTDVD